MSDFHQLRVEGPNKEKIESVAPHFQKEKLHWARDQSWKAYSTIKESLQSGMNEREAFDRARKLLDDLGASKHWHKPVIRFGSGTTLTFHDPLQETNILQENDPVFIDLGPVWYDEETRLEYEGDVGDTFVFGHNKEAEKCAQTARQIFSEVEEIWKRDKITGVQIYEQLNKKSKKYGYLLLEEVQGHRISDFPHHKFSKKKLGTISFEPVPLLWVLEVHIRHPQLNVGAFYEDILGLSNR